MKVTDEELKGVSDYEKRKALWLRYAFTKKMLTLEDAELLLRDCPPAPAARFANLRINLKDSGGT